MSGMMPSPLAAAACTTTAMSSLLQAARLAMLASGPQ